jgi:hypothetical protein
MRTKKQTAAEHRQRAADCIDDAQRMSLRSDRERLMEMAQRWLDLAKLAEAPRAKAARRKLKR